MSKPKTVRILALSRLITADSRVVEQGTVAALPEDEATRFVTLGAAEPAPLEEPAPEAPAPAPAQR